MVRLRSGLSFLSLTTRMALPLDYDIPSTMP